MYCIKNNYLIVKAAVLLKVDPFCKTTHSNITGSPDLRIFKVLIAVADNEAPSPFKGGTPFIFNDQDIT